MQTCITVLRRKCWAGAQEVIASRLRDYSEYSGCLQPQKAIHWIKQYLTCCQAVIKTFRNAVVRDSSRSSLTLYAATRIALTVSI